MSVIRGLTNEPSESADVPAPPRWSVGQRSAAVTGVLVLLLLCLGACWAVSSPVGSSPDDDFHLGSIWCSPAGGSCEETGTEFSPGQQEVLVPARIATGAAACFTFRGDESAACTEPLPATDELQPSRANAGLYPSGFYTVMGLLVSENIARAVLSMRMLSWIA